MKAKLFHSGGLRTFLDCVLLLAVILVIVGNMHTAEAKTENQVTAQRSPMVGTKIQTGQDFATVEITSTIQVPGAVSLDNNQLAAMIAAENAALTPPQYLTDLPIIAR